MATTAASCLPTTQPAQHSSVITREASYWFTHGYTNDPVCASATLYQAIVANGETLCLGFLRLPTEIRTSGNSAGAADAFIEALGFYYKGKGSTGDGWPGSPLCKARKLMVPELIAAIANNALLGTDPGNATYDNGGVTNFPPDLIEQAGLAAAGVDVVQIKYWTTLLKKFNASGVTNDLPTGLQECTPNTRAFLRGLAQDPTSRLTCPGINDNCAAAKAIVFPAPGSIFAPARFRDSVGTTKLPSGEAYWHITPAVGTTNRPFTVSTGGSNFVPGLSVLNGYCSIVASSSGTPTVDASGLTVVATTVSNSTTSVTNIFNLAQPPKLSFVTDGVSDYYILVNGGVGKVKLTVTSP